MLILMSAVVVIFSCAKHDYQNEMSERLNVQFKDSLQKYDLVVILPGSGCTGCITNAENFFIKNVYNEKIKFVLTYNNSKKNLGLKLGKGNLYLPNVFIDENNFFYLKDFEERIYPMAIVLENGHIVKIVGLDSVI